MSLTRKEQAQIQTLSLGILMELVVAGKKDTVLPLIEKNPVLLTKTLARQFVEGAWNGEQQDKVPMGYTKALVDSIKAIQTKPQPTVPEKAEGKLLQAPQPGQELQG
jgi:hypothetical protein